jgi:hypothetical protein
MLSALSALRQASRQLSLEPFEHLRHFRRAVTHGIAVAIPRRNLNGRA